MKYAVFRKRFTYVDGLLVPVYSAKKIPMLYMKIYSGYEIAYGDLNAGSRVVLNTMLYGFAGVDVEIRLDVEYMEKLLCWDVLQYGYFRLCVSKLLKGGWIIRKRKSCYVVNAERVFVGSEADRLKILRRGI